MTVGKSFITHCKRERSSGRECPAQWSWIGGLVGPTNPTWHLEMRDFLTLPQYDYCCNPWQIIDVKDPSHLPSISSPQQMTPNKDESDNLMFLPKVLIGYGSETGNAEATAYSLARKLRLCRPTTLSLNEIAASDELLSGKFTHFFAICSTFGAGEFPRNAIHFPSKASDYKLTNELSFAVLALGSSLYPDFCEAGRALDEIMSESGATSLANVTCIDAAKGNHAPISKWLNFIEKTLLPQALLSQIRENVDLGDDEIETTYHMKWTGDEYNVDEENLYPHIVEKEDSMVCQENNELIKGGRVMSRSTRHITLTIPEGMSYSSGDHLSIKPLNSLSMVVRFCACFRHQLEKAAVNSGYYRRSEKPNSNESSLYSSSDTNLTSYSSFDSSLSAPLTWQIQQPFYIECAENGQMSLHRAEHLTNKTLKEVLEEYIDLSLEQYAVDLFSMLSSRLEDVSFLTNKNLHRAQNFIKVAKDAIGQYNDNEEDSKLKCLMHQYPTVIHLFEEYQDLFCVPVGNLNSDPLISIADVLVLMSRLKPRYYSISSSSISSPTQLAITVGVVNIRNQHGNLLRGVCSHYLAGLKVGDRVGATIVESSFRAPEHLAQSLWLELVRVSPPLWVSSKIGPVSCEINPHTCPRESKGGGCLESGTYFLDADLTMNCYIEKDLLKWSHQG